MAEIIAFKRNHIRGESVPRSGGTCDIVFFPGVRYEKREDAIALAGARDGATALPALPVAT